MLDFQVLWGMPVGVFVWDQPKKEGRALLGIHTRISQVFRVIFSQKADWDNPWLIYVFYLLAGTFLIMELIALAIGISMTRAMTSAVLCSAGATVHGAASPAEALAHPAADVAVLDLGLPTPADGTQLIQQLQERSPAMKLIVLSGWTRDLQLKVDQVL